MKGKPLRSTCMDFPVVTLYHHQTQDQRVKDELGPQIARPRIAVPAQLVLSPGHCPQSADPLSAVLTGTPVQNNLLELWGRE